MYWRKRTEDEMLVTRLDCFVWLFPLPFVLWKAAIRVVFIKLCWRCVVFRSWVECLLICDWSATTWAQSLCVTCFISLSYICTTSPFWPTALTVALMLHCCVRPSVICLSVVCNVCIVAKRCVLPKKNWRKQIGSGLWRIEWSRDRWPHLTLKGQG